VKFPTHPFKDGRLGDVRLIGEAAWRILLYLIANAKDEPVEHEVGRAGTIIIGRTQLAKETNVAVQTVREALPRLASIGAIGYETRKGLTTTITVYPRWVPPVETTPVALHPAKRSDTSTRRDVVAERGGSTRQVEQPEVGWLTRQADLSGPLEGGRPTRQVDLEGGRPTRQVDHLAYSSSALARAHVQNVNHTGRRDLANLHGVSDFDPVVLGVSGVSPGYLATTSGMEPTSADLRDEPLAPVATAPDTQKEAVISSEFPGRREKTQDDCPDDGQCYDMDGNPIDCPEYADVS
jgi:hypothetical protein